MDTLLILFIILAILLLGLWLWACAVNTIVVREAMLQAVDKSRPVFDRPRLRGLVAAVSVSAHFNRELLLRNPLTLYHPALRRLCTPEALHDPD